MALWRYPVKAMLGERLQAVDVGLGGLEGDRHWIVVDVNTGERIANKRGPTDPRLRSCRAELIDGFEEDPPLRVTLPDGDTREGPEVAAALSGLLERTVRLEASTSPALGRFADTGAHHDLAPIHLLAASTIERFRALAPDSVWDARRFRPNLVVDDGAAGDGFAEDALLGARLRGESGLELTVGLPTPRCVVPTRAHEELPADPAILRTIVREHRLDLGRFGRQGCVGAYAEVARQGSIRVGERLEVVPGSGPPEEGMRAVLARLAELPDAGAI